MVHRDNNNDNKYNKVAVLGAGRWGSAFAIYLQRLNFSVTLYSYGEDSVRQIKGFGYSSYLPNYSFAKPINVYSDINRAVADQDLIVIAIPTPFLEDELANITNLSPKTIIIGISKGMVGKKLQLIPELVSDIFPKNSYFHLGGPCFPDGLLGKGAIASETLAGKDNKLALILQEKLSSASLRLYLSSDVKGVAFLGAVKNVFAIAAGVIEGAKLNDELRAILVTRGLTEITRLGKIFKVNPSTIYGLSGLGDLVLTCYSSQSSHNCRLGKLITEQGSVSRALELMGRSVPEGYFATKLLQQLAHKHNIDTPLIMAVYSLLYENKSVDKILISLMSRPLKKE
ncbi:MAG: NAD(P)H-dependent glycerol-3-phosphate dehydrogenase [SAR324 cluster bacterium]|nr:NAD(P)H-dependent glycerol-3-phosphate dehydrogenase [SAR324 cluster bacterium]